MVLPFVAVTVLVEVVLLLGTAVVWIRVGRHDPVDTLWLRPLSGIPLLGAVLTAAGAWSLGQLTVALQAAIEPSAAQYFERFSRELGALFEGVSLPVLLLVVGVVPAVAEEVCFRGIVMRAFYARGSVTVAIVASSLIFGLFHFDIGPFRILPTAVLAVIIGASVIATRSILAGMLIHAVNNSLGILAFRSTDVQEFIATPAVTGAALLSVVAGLMILGVTARRRRAAEG